MSRGRVAREAARFLRQQAEAGADEIFLDRLTRDEAMGLVARRDAPPTGEGAVVPEGGSAGRRVPVVQEGPGEGRGVSRSAGATPELPGSLEELRVAAAGCTRCRLAGGRTQAVFSDGAPDARVVVVGEAPGAKEDETGVPFVGAAGQFLDLLLATVGLSRKESVYICNVLKCRPPGNRNPLPDEIEACAPFLRRQIELVRPQALLAVGSFSGKLLTGVEGGSLAALRGQVHAYEGLPLVVTYHPAALLRNPHWVRPFWDDLQLLRSVLDAA